MARALVLLTSIGVLTSAAGTVRIHGAGEPQQPAEKTIPDQVRLFIPFTPYPAEDNKRILDMYKYLRVADGDGVIVVPRERAEEVAKAALPFLDNIARERYIRETGQNPWKQD
jgi:hypothetical protein